MILPTTDVLPTTKVHCPNSGKLTASQAQLLTSKANAIIHSLSV